MYDKFCSSSFKARSVNRFFPIFFADVSNLHHKFDAIFADIGRHLVRPSIQSAVKHKNIKNSLLRRQRFLVISISFVKSFVLNNDTYATRSTTKIMFHIDH